MAVLFIAKAILTAAQILIIIVSIIGITISLLKQAINTFYAENVVIMIPAPRAARFQLLDDHDGDDDWQLVEHHDAGPPRRITRAAARRNGEPFVVIPRGE